MVDAQSMAACACAPGTAESSARIVSVILVKAYPNPVGLASRRAATRARISARVSTKSSQEGWYVCSGRIKARQLGSRDADVRVRGEELRVS